MLRTSASSATPYGKPPHQIRLFIHGEPGLLPQDLTRRFLLHVEAAAPADLSLERRAFGYANLDFDFAQNGGSWVGEPLRGRRGPARLRNRGRAHGTVRHGRRRNPRRLAGRAHGGRDASARRCRVGGRRTNAATEYTVLAEQDAASRTTVRDAVHDRIALFCDFKAQRTRLQWQCAGRRHRQFGRRAARVASINAPMAATVRD